MGLCKCLQAPEHVLPGGSSEQHLLLPCPRGCWGTARAALGWEGWYPKSQALCLSQVWKISGHRKKELLQKYGRCCSSVNLRVKAFKITGLFPVSLKTLSHPYFDGPKWNQNVKYLNQNHLLGWWSAAFLAENNFQFLSIKKNYFCLF